MENGDIVINSINEDLPFNDDEFGVIIATQVLEHIPNPFKIVDEFYRICKMVVELLFRYFLLGIPSYPK